jgi:outer membrane protein OmpA-like peptidoglycan-associated protein
MRNGAKLILIAALCGTAAACTGLNPNTSDDLDLLAVDVDAARNMAPQGPPFIEGLRTGYFNLADYDSSTGDIADTSHFSRKAVAAAKAMNVQPDAVSYRSLDEAGATELGAARARLMSALDAGGRLRAATEAARAQVAYDCWLEAQDAGDGSRIELCKATFEDAMAKVEQALAPETPDTFLVFFAWDSSELTPVTLEVVDNVARAWKEGRHTHLIVAGHADRSGSATYNERLSERRAEAVAAALVAREVPRDAMDVQWFGETRLRIETPDGTREPQNRRVEITVE